MTKEKKSGKKRNYVPVNNRNLDHMDISKDEKKAIVQSNLKASLRWFDKEIPKTKEEAEERMVEFFQTCIKYGETPTVEKMALAFGTSRQVLWEWETGKSRPELTDTIQKGKQILADFDATMAVQGKIHPTTYIFRAKNFFGMKDKVEYDITPKNPMGDRVNPEEIKKRIEGSVVIEGEKTEDSEK